MIIVETCHPLYTVGQMIGYSGKRVVNPTVREGSVGLTRTHAHTRKHTYYYIKDVFYRYNPPK